MEVFSVKNKNKNVVKIEQKKKDYTKGQNQQLWFGYANRYRQWGNAHTKKFLETHWKTNFTKQ